MQFGAQSVAFLTRLDVPFWMKVQPLQYPPPCTGGGPAPAGAGPLAWPLGEAVIYVTSALVKTCGAVMI
jgi:hypothetical protein